MPNRPGPEQKGFDFEGVGPPRDFSPTPLRSAVGAKKERRKTYDPDEECAICQVPKNNCPHYGEVKKPEKPPWEKHSPK